MPSEEDAKPVKVQREVKGEEEDDKMSLGTIMLNHKKKSTKIMNNANGNSTSAAREAKVKKEEQLGKDSDKPTKAKPKQEPRVKKEEKNNGSEDERGSNAKRSSNAMPDKELKKRTIKKMEEEEEEKKKKKKKGSEVTQEQKKKEKKGPDATTELKKREKKEKKVYDLPGQKRDPPDERDPLRIFYETLYEQVPKSEMAQFWLMECGLLSKEEAKRVFEKKQKRSQQQKLGSPMKAVASVKKSTQSVTVKKPSTPVPSNQKKSTVSKDASTLSKKRKNEDKSSESDSDDDFALSTRLKKKRQAA
ncbi:hypothetical protein CerSpe_039200 [Prunus speciosa]